jgi:ribosomal protein S18 acetylase RimI-like enzyme
MTGPQSARGLGRERAVTEPARRTQKYRRPLPTVVSTKRPIIRELRGADQPDLLEWHRRLYLHIGKLNPRRYQTRLSRQDVEADTKESLRLLRRARGFVLIAELEQEPVGFVMAEVLEFPPRHHRLTRRPELTGQIDTLFVEERARNMGVGTALLQAAEKRLRAEGCDNLQLGVVEENETARNLYAGLGYRELGRRLRKDVGKPPRDWEDVRRQRRLVR